MSKKLEIHKGSTKQMIYELLSAYAGDSDGLDRDIFIASACHMTGLSSVTIEQYLREVSGQVHTRNGRLIVDSDALLISKTSRITQGRSNRTGHGSRSGAMPGWHWRKG